MRRKLVVHGDRLIALDRDGIARRLVFQRPVQGVIAGAQVDQRHHLLDLGPGRVEMRQQGLQLVLLVVGGLRW